MLNSAYYILYHIIDLSTMWASLVDWISYIMYFSLYLEIGGTRESIKKQKNVSDINDGDNVRF